MTAPGTQSVRELKANFRDLTLGGNFGITARNEGKTITQKLEEEDPSAQYRGTEFEGTDAYERQLIRFNIRTRTDWKRMLPASTLDDFVNPKDERGNAVKPSDTRFFASDQPQSWILYPEFINRQMRIIPLPGDVLEEIVGMVTPVDTDLYKTIYLNDNIQTAPGQAQRQLVRVGEGVEIPPMTIGTFENGVKLNKHGIALRGTYETYRRLRVDLFSIFLARIAMQIKLDLATEASNVLVNGDGNSNSAPNYNVSSLDPAAPAGPGTVTDLVTSATSSITKGLTYASWIKWRASLYPLAMTTVVGRLNELIQILTLQMPNIDPLTFLALLQQPDQRAQTGTMRMAVNVFGSQISLVYHPWAPGGLLTGLDKRFGVEQLIETNSSLTETDKDIRTQMNEIVISQVTGFDKFLTLASSTLTFA